MRMLGREAGILLNQHIMSHSRLEHIFSHGDRCAIMVTGARAVCVVRLVHLPACRPLSWGIYLAPSRLVAFLPESPRRHALVSPRRHAHRAASSIVPAQGVMSSPLDILGATLI
jgi:hypothetical protein